MIQENELIRLILGIGMLVFLEMNKKELLYLKYYKLIIASLGFLLCGWIFTIIEGLAYPVLFNTLEHMSYTVSGGFLMLWCYKALYKDEDDHESHQPD